MRIKAGACSLWTLALLATARADDPVFSGPQVGEPLAPFTVRGVFDDLAGKELDLVARADGGPIVLVFVHDANRPSIAVARVLMTYAERRAKDGLVGGIVWLADDATAAEQFLKRARHALPKQAPVTLSVDGREGPGAYGLNRNVTLTVLVGKEGTVTANFALVQPSVAADVPKILAEVVKVAGGTVPSLAEVDPGLAKMARPNPAGEPNAPEPDPNLRPLLRELIRRDAEPEAVDRAAKAIEAYIAEHEPAGKEVGRIARTIIDAGKLANYGTPKAQEYLRAWADRLGPARPKD